MEDVALARKLGRKITLIPNAIITSARRYEGEGWLRRGARNLCVLTLYLLGRAPEKLVRFYRAGKKG